MHIPSWYRVDYFDSANIPTLMLCNRMYSSLDNFAPNALYCCGVA